MVEDSEKSHLDVSKSSKFFNVDIVIILYYSAIFVIHFVVIEKFLEILACEKVVEIFLANAIAIN